MPGCTGKDGMRRQNKRNENGAHAHVLDYLRDGESISIGAATQAKAIWTPGVCVCNDANHTKPM